MHDALPRLHVVTDDAVLARDGFAQTASSVLWRGGEDVALHLRGHHTPTRRLLRLAELLLPIARDVGALLLVNDRIDIALAAGAHGVQLGIRSIPVRPARKLLGDRWIGYSAHSAEAAIDARAEGTDFVLLGTIYPSDTHARDDAAGVDLVRRTAPLLPRVPLLAIGGVTPTTVAELSAAGVYGVAVLSRIWRAPDPKSSVSQFLVALDAHPSQRSGHAGNGKHNRAGQR